MLTIKLINEHSLNFKKILEIINSYPHESFNRPQEFDYEGFQHALMSVQTLTKYEGLLFHLLPERLKKDIVFLLLYVNESILNIMRWKYSVFQHRNIPLLISYSENLLNELNKDEIKKILEDKRQELKPEWN